MAYALRKINRNMTHYGFCWDITIGAVNTAPNWKPTRRCGNGLHFCAPGDDLEYLIGNILVVVEYDETKAINLGGKHKSESCKIVWVSENGSTDGLEEFIDPLSFGANSNKSAYYWALNIGDKEHIRQFVTDSEWAYRWARDIGDREHMKQFITEPEHAYLWALNIGDEEHMRQFVTEPEWAYYWALNIGDKEHMRQFVTSSQYAYWWARDIGDREHMKQFITEPEHAYLWARILGDKEHMRQFVTGTRWAIVWEKAFKD